MRYKEAGNFPDHGIITHHPRLCMCVFFFKLQCVTWSYTKVVPPSTLTKWPVFDYITQTLLTFWTSEPCLHYGTEVWCCASQCQPIIPFFDTRFIFCDLTEFRRFANRKHSQSDAGMNLAFFKFDRIIGWTIFIANTLLIEKALKNISCEYDRWV